MKKYRFTLDIDIDDPLPHFENASADEHKNLALNLVDHLMETFNDDDSVYYISIESSRLVGRWGKPGPAYQPLT